MSKFKKSLSLITVLTSISYLTYRQISNALFEKVFKRQDVEIELKEGEEKWFSNSNCKTVSIQSFDGLKLNGYIIKNNDSNQFVLLSHGYGSDSRSMFYDAVHFDELGYNTLIIDHRASGESEGNYHTFGQKESLDILLWCHYLVEQFPNCKIALYGVSMGAASVLMSLALSLPTNVKCCIEDCSYSSLKEELDNTIKLEYKLEHNGIILRLIENRMQKVFGFNFSDAEVKEFIKDNTIPLLIIHGKEDTFVPFEMSKVIYNSNKGVKKYYPIDGAKHAVCHYQANYFKHVNDFISEYFM